MGLEDADSADQEAKTTTPGKPDKPDQPDKSAGELDVGWGERPRDPGRLSEEDEHLLRERPPHWE